MEISARARAFLERLPRHPAMPVADLKRHLLEAELPVCGPWLQFHERFAGYEEDLGNDRVVWGIGHQHPVWVPEPFDFDREPGSIIITCADGHPSYDYWLDLDGEFLGRGGGGPCESFVKHVEQLALVSELPKGARWLDKLEAGTAAQLEANAEQIGEASDEYSSWFSGPNYVVKRQENGNLSVWGVPTLSES